MMLRNENLTSDSMNAVTFQLTKQFRMNKYPKERTEVDQTIITNIIDHITKLTDIANTDNDNYVDAPTIMTT